MTYLKTTLNKNFISDDIKEKDRAMSYALKLLSRYSRSKKDIYTRLSLKSFSTESIEYVLCRLKEMGYVDDKKFMYDLILNRKQQFKSINFIKNELQLKGVDNEIINQVIKEIYDISEEKEYLKMLAKNKLSQLKKIPAKKKLTKLVSFLKRNGYEIEQIKESLGSVIDKIENKALNHIDLN